MFQLTINKSICKAILGGNLVNETIMLEKNKIMVLILEVYTNILMTS